MIYVKIKKENKMIKLTNILKEDEYIDKAYSKGDTPADNPIDDYDELDVEQEDMDDFINYLKSYQSSLDEANCGCVYEAEYQGREVKLGKPMAGDVKKFKVYVKNPKTGKVIKVNFGQKGVKIKKNNPGRRANFRARHNCDNPGPRTKARYWSCRKW
jgi:predicted DNA binding protein